MPLGDRSLDDQSYYPTAKLRLIIRLEEFQDVKTVASKVPSKSTKNLNGVLDDRNNLTVSPDSNAPPGVTRLVLQPAGAPPVASPQAASRSADGLTFDVTVLPAELTWEQNGIRTADTLSASIRWIDLPIDSRLVRSCAVEAYVGTVSADDFASGSRGGVRPAGDPNNPDASEPMNLVPDSYVDEGGNQRTNLRFQGFTDEWEVDWSGSGEPMIHIKCRDNTQLLIDQEAPARLLLDMTKPIPDAVAQYMGHFVQFAGMSVEYLPVGETPPMLKDALASTAFRPNLGPPPSKGGGGAHQLSVWDYLTDVCGSIGHIIRVVGTAVIIQRVRSYTTGAIVRRPDDPYRPRSVGGEQLDFRRFIYGANVLSMKTKRSYAKAKAVNVEVRCYNTEKKSTLVARFPLPADRAGSSGGKSGVTEATPGDAKPDEKWSVFRVSGIKDDKTLRAVAQGIYEQLGRQEIHVEIETKALASFGSDNADPDLLDMQPGDTLDVLARKDEQNQAQSSVTRVEQAMQALPQGAALLKSLGFADDFANAYAKAYSNQNFLTQLRVKEMKLDWSTDDGIKLSIKGMNYIEIRMDKLLPQGEEPGS